LGPSSENPAVNDLYVADRRVDNNSDPTENDGQIYEFSFNVGSTLNFAPIADARVQDNALTTNYGTSTSLRARSSAPAYSTYFKFSVGGLTSAVQSAKLRLYVADASKVGGSIYLVSNNFLNSTTPWTESGLIWQNAPSISGTPLHTLGAVALNSWAEFDVTAAFQGDGTYSFGLTSTSQDAVYFNSREAAVNQPELVIQLSGIVATATPAPTATNTPPPTATSTNTPVPPTATATNTDIPPTNTATNTSAPPTATNTPVPPTATATNTPAPPTATPTNTVAPSTNTPTSTPQPPTATPTASPTLALTTLNLTPNADARVQDNTPTTNYGTSTSLRARSSAPAYCTYFNFTVSGVTRPVQSAKLRLFVVDASKVGGSIYQVSNNYLNTSTPWTEGGLIWSNAPLISGAPLSTLGAVALNTWVEFDVTAAITGNGIYSFGLTSTSQDAVYFNSKESTTNKPVLVITY
jgi:hypothetical protein